MKPSDPGSDPTLLQDIATGDTAHDSSPSLPEAQRKSVPLGYEIGVLLGRGGMGEVVLATDEQIGRDVAIKRMRGDLGAQAEARFLREAHIQARLDHPAIVPVHQIGRDPEGRPFFTMKRLTGTTLEQNLASATQQRLLRTFVDVCNAIDFAHSRGIVHRDLKPANIMLGDYGEVYVIDWGVARVLAEEDHAPLAKVPTDSGQTELGSMLGTPGYMSPEQVNGEAVGTPTDVYALGAILFEILTGEPLHPRGAAAISATLKQPTLSPQARKPDLPPELCAATVDAPAAVAAERPTAHALAERIERYLDGDRDLAQRKKLATAQLALAHDALAANDRGAAMQTAGRALALDPESREAAQILTQLTLEPPAKTPPELEAHLDAVDVAVARRQWLQVGIAWLGFFLPLPLIASAGIRAWQEVSLFYILVGCGCAISLYWSKRGKPNVHVSLVISVVAMVALSRAFGPFMVIPTVLAVMGNGFLSYPQYIRRPAIPIAGILVGFLSIFLLESIGVFAPTWSTAGNLVVVSTGFALDGARGSVLLISANAIAIVVSALFARSIAVSRWETHRKLEIQAWHLRKLVIA